VESCLVDKDFPITPTGETDVIPNPILGLYAMNLMTVWLEIKPELPMMTTFFIFSCFNCVKKLFLSRFLSKQVAANV